MHKRHPLLIPTGDFCYHTEPMTESVVIPPTSPRLGRDLREATWATGEKMVLCPYWTHTDHGTVRCDYLKREVMSLEPGAYDSAYTHFGAEATRAIKDDTLLADMLKVCDVRHYNPNRMDFDLATLFKDDEPA